MPYRSVCNALPILLLIVACDRSPEARARELYPNRARALAAERPFRRNSATRAEVAPGICPPVLEDVASRSLVTLRGWADVEERRRSGGTMTISRWQRGYYVPKSATLVGLAPGEEYAMRCDRLVADSINVPDVRPPS